MINNDVVPQLQQHFQRQIEGAFYKVWTLNVGGEVGNLYENVWNTWEWICAILKALAFLVVNQNIFGCMSFTLLCHHILFNFILISSCTRGYALTLWFWCWFRPHRIWFMCRSTPYTL
jgi:hypothetical protein